MKANNTPPTLSKAMVAIGFIALLVLLTAIFNKVLRDIKNPNQQLSLSVDDYGNKSVTLKRNRYGHYVATGKINDYPVDFFVDTGATRVAIPKYIADKINLKRGLKSQAQTANGLTTFYDTTIDKLSLGGITMTNVPASIAADAGLDTILLGMSFLKHLHLTQRNNTLTISVPDDKR